MDNNLKSKPNRKDIDVSLLDFDPENPRFPAEIASGPTNELLERFIRDERLLEIVTSIADQGYFEGEPLLVTPKNDRYIVIEGNRRLAALKLLTGELKAPEGRISIDEVCEGANFKPSEVPCLIFDDPDQTLRYLGFRHITGIKAWGPLQKARYLKKLKDKFFSDLDSKAQLLHLSREIGSRSDYVGQILASLNLYERAERTNFYDVKGLNPEEIEFSVLSTALGYKNIVAYIGLDGRQDILGEQVSDDKLKNLLTWMFVARGDQKPILGDSRNLSKLAAIVDSDTATIQLINDGNLDAAFQLSKGPA
jgi:ParB-like chromosome segregation protein Spo0J